jgi:AcrR family transcriptional regulator
MRAVAQEAGCAVGLPYKVFVNREELVLELVAVELGELTRELDGWMASAGERTVGENLDRFAGIFLESETPALLGANEIDEAGFLERVRRMTSESGLVRSFDEAVAQYLAAEQRLGRVRADVDVAAFGFLITGAVHNLVVAGDLYPRPARDRLRAHLDACARAIGVAG